MSIAGSHMTRIRLEQPEDYRAIHALHAASFPTSAEACLVDALRESCRLFLSLVALDSDRIVGHVAFSPVSLTGVPSGVGLAPVAVLSGHRQRGIAAQLIREGLRRCGQAGCGFVVVLGEPRYYQRFGFLPAIRWGLTDEYGGGEAFQALELDPGSIPQAGGLVRYAPEFSQMEQPNG